MTIRPVEVGPAAAAPPGQPPPPPAPPPRSVRLRRVAVAAGVAAVALGVVLRFALRSELWLDETLSVNIARLPLGDIPGALRHDGAPPLYYVLLHGWMRLFGDGNVAVRSLSGVLSLAALPAAWVAGRRLGGRELAVTTLLVTASSPFATRYATEARMYSLVVLLTLLGCVALFRALEDPAPRRLLPVGLVTAALPLTHYWAIYLLAVVGGLLVWWALGEAGPRARAARRCLWAMGAGALAFLPWLPTFAYQVAHTGTPWAGRPAPAAIVEVIRHFAGAHTDAGAFLALLYPALHALAVFGRPLAPRRVEIDLSNRGPAVALAVAALGSVVLGVLVSRLTGGAFIARYASVALGPFLLLAAMGVLAFAPGHIRGGVLALVVALGLAVGLTDMGASRTQAGQVAAAVERLGRPGDVVVYCPDQLGPATSRLLPAGTFDQLTYPAADPPGLVDWVDYEERNQAGEPARFARQVLDRAGEGRQVFVVWAPQYRTFGRSCERLLVELRRARTAVERVRAGGRHYERMTLVQFLAP